MPTPTIGDAGTGREVNFKVWKFCIQPLFASLTNSLVNIENVLQFSFKINATSVFTPDMNP